MEVGTLSRKEIFHLLSQALHLSIRFFHYPLPAMPSVGLTASLSFARNISGLPCFDYPTSSNLGSSFSPVKLHPRLSKLSGSILVHLLFSQAYQHLWLVRDNDVYQKFTYVNLITLP